jgi:hypothetical protein
VGLQRTIQAVVRTSSHLRLVVTEVLTEVHCSFITLLWYGCFRSSSKVLAPMRVKEIPHGQPLRRPQHLWHIPITVHMRIRVKGATTHRGARNTPTSCTATAMQSQPQDAKPNLPSCALDSVAWLGQHDIWAVMPLLAKTLRSISEQPRQF